MKKYSLNETEAPLDIVDEKYVLEGLNGMCLDKSIVELDKPNLFFKDGTPVLKEHVTNIARIYPGSNLHILMRVKEFDEHDINIINSKGEFLLDNWKSLLDYYSVALDENCELPLS